MSSMQISLPAIQSSKPADSANDSNAAAGNSQSAAAGISAGGSGASTSNTASQGAGTATKGDFRKVLQEKSAKSDSQPDPASDAVTVQQVMALLVQLGAVQTGTSNQTAESISLSKGTTADNASPVTVNFPKLLELIPNLKQLLPLADAPSKQPAGMAQNQLQLIQQLLDKAKQGPIQMKELKLLLESVNQTGANAFEHLLNAAVPSNKGLFANVQFKQPAVLPKTGSTESADSQSVPVRQITADSPVVPRAAGSVWINQMKAESFSQQPNSEQGSKKLTLPESTASFTPLQSLGQQHLQPLIRQEEIKVPAGNLQEQLQTLLVKNAVYDSANGQNTFKLTLLPEGLGEIQVIVQSHGDSGAVSVQLLADTSAAKDLLNSTLSGLRTGLEAQGVTVSKLEVGTQPAAESFAMHTGFNDDHSGSRGQEPKDDSRRRDSQPATVEELSAGGIGSAFSDQWLEFTQAEANGGSGKENINLIA